jgi:hypothetical protein
VALAAERHINFNATLELNPQEHIWDEIREKVFKNYAAKSMDEVCEMLVEGSLYIERNPELVKSMTSFPYIASSI